MPTLRSHTYLQDTQAITQTKACEKVCLPNRTDLATLDRDCSIKKNNEHLTAPKKNGGGSANTNSYATNKVWWV